ncbi:uncharacterized protein LOC141851334 [Brevipalpus obovatus]|uniref:uncharacterized protein LOC141851334 n=1 Tax=Brevipalpus obovatus TaxID=246614 RepID=UPI003D9E3E97
MIMTIPLPCSVILIFFSITFDHSVRSSSTNEYYKPNCEKERKMLEDLKQKDGHCEGCSIPKCEQDGTYSPEQFQSTKNTSWCVTPDGKVIPDTFMKLGIPRKKDCSEIRAKSKNISIPWAEMKSFTFSSSIPTSL